MSEVSDDATMDLQAVKLLATYLSPGLREPGTRHALHRTDNAAGARFRRLRARCARSADIRVSVAALDQLNVLIEDDSASGNPTLQLIAGYIYSYEQEYEKALRAIHNGYTLEQYVFNQVALAACLPAYALQATLTTFVSRAQAGSTHPNFAQDRSRRYRGARAEEHVQDG
jgi:hypothetical protein